MKVVGTVGMSHRTWTLNATRRPQKLKETPLTAEITQSSVMEFKGASEEAT